MNNSFKLLLFVSFFAVFFACRNSDKTDKNQAKPISNKEKIDTLEKNQSSNKHTAPGGVYSFERPTDFGLAVNKNQVLVKSVIPPCKDGFDYCLYYNGKKYENTNFESAGIGFYVLENVGEVDCSSAKTYNGRKENLHSEKINDIEFIVFSSGSAATGHYAKDVVYQTFHDGKCYQFIARIGASQFENYPLGSIEKFNPKMEAEMREALKEIIRRIEFNSH